MPEIGSCKVTSMCTHAYGIPIGGRKTVAGISTLEKDMPIAVRCKMTAYNYLPVKTMPVVG